MDSGLRVKVSLRFTISRCFHEGLVVLCQGIFWDSMALLGEGENIGSLLLMTEILPYLRDPKPMGITVYSLLWAMQDLCHQP